MKTFFMSSLIMLASALPAFATDLSPNEGKYTDSPYSNGSEDAQDILILKRGSQVRLIDRKNNIKFSLDLNNPMAQNFPQKMLTHLSETMPYGTLVGTMDRVQIEDLRQDGPNSVRGSLRIKMMPKSSFGLLIAEIKLGFVISLTNYDRAEQATPANNFNPPIHRATAITWETGTTLDLVSLSTNLGPSADKTLGLFADFGLKILSPLFSEKETLFNDPT